MYFCVAFVLDFDYLSSKKGLNLKTSRMEIDVPVSELKCSLELSGWQDYSDARACGVGLGLGGLSLHCSMESV